MRIEINIDPRLAFENIREQQIIPELVHLVGEINEESAAGFKQDIEIAECLANQSGQTILPICIDSFGGEAYAMMACIDAIDACKLPVATIIEGKAMSAAAIIFSCGANGFRFMGPNATLMVHAAWACAEGKVDSMESEVREVRKLNDRALSRMSYNCGLPSTYFKKLIRETNNTELYLTAPQCKKIGLANHLKIPTWVVNVCAENKFVF